LSWIEIKKPAPESCRHYVSNRVKFLAFASAGTGAPFENRRAFGGYRRYFYAEIMRISGERSAKASASGAETIKQTLRRKNRAERLPGGED
jgi:hypothetical protein